jgi:hypothetical protein
MSLDWDTAKCPAYITAKAARDEDEESEAWTNFVNLRDRLIWATMCTKFPPGDWAITTKNWREMFARFRMYDQIYSPRATQITPEDVVSMIGLSTNAGSFTDRQFNTEVIRRMRIDPMDRLRAYEQRMREANE